MPDHVDDERPFSPEERAKMRALLSTLTPARVEVLGELVDDSRFSRRLMSLIGTIVKWIFITAAGVGSIKLAGDYIKSIMSWK